MIFCHIKVHAILILLIVVYPPFLIGSQDTDNVSNAGFYYLKAAELLQFPDSSDINEKIGIIIKDGWKEKVVKKHLLVLLQNNKSCLMELNKGFALEYCNFQEILKENQSTALYGQDLGMSTIIKLSKLVALKAAYLEYQQKQLKACQYFVSLLTFAEHIANESLLVKKLSAIEIEKISIRGLKRLCPFSDFSAREANEIHQSLVKYLKNRFHFHEIIEIEKNEYLSLIQKITQHNNSEIRKNKPISPQLKKILDLLKISSQKYADEYYGLIIAATILDTDSSWQKIESYIERFPKVPDIQFFISPSAANIEQFLAKIENPNPENIADYLNQAILRTFHLNARPIFRAWKDNQDQINTIIKGRFPLD